MSRRVTRTLRLLLGRERRRGGARRGRGARPGRVRGRRCSTAAPSGRRRPAATRSLRGPPGTQAGGHPYEAWTAFEMNRGVRSDGGPRAATAATSAM